MTEKKEDLRIRRTHKLLCEAMFSLLENNSYDDISIVDICDKAMVHRATFYKHFNDKSDFMEYVARVKIREFYDNGAKIHVSSDLQNAYHVLVENVITFVESNKSMLRLSINSSSNNFIESLHKIIYEEMLDLINILAKNGEVFSTPPEIKAQFLTGGFCELLRWWIRNENVCSKEQLIDYIEKLLRTNRDIC